MGKDSPLNALARVFSHHSREQTDIVMLAHDEALLCTVDGFGELGASAEMAVVALRRNDRPLRHAAFTLPSDAILQDMVLNPTGDYVAWVFRRDYVPSVAVLLHRLWPAYRVQPQSRTSLWISRPDGSDLREIG